MLGALVVPGAAACPGNEILGCRKYGHIAADFRKDQDCSHRILIHTRNGTNQIEMSRVGFHKSKNFLLNAIPVSVQLINVIQAFPQFDGLLRTDSAVNGILDLINRSLAVFVNERCDIELLTGVSKDVFGNRPGGLSENICEHIIQFKAGDG